MKQIRILESDLEKTISAVKQNVIGQDQAVEQVCSLIDMGKTRWELLENSRVKPNLAPQFCSALLIGTSGSGKTYMLKNIAEQEDMIFWEIDATTLTGEGWKGTSLSAHWDALSQEMQRDPDKMALIFIDEVDKIFKNDSYYDAGSAKFDLLKPLEGGTWKAESNNSKQMLEMNFDRCVVVMSGAFTGIDAYRAESEVSIGFEGTPKVKRNKREKVSREDLVQWGAPRELVGRFSLMLNLNELTRQDYKKIIDTQLIQKHSALLPNFTLKIDEAAADFLADEALEKKLGARYINQRISDLVTKKIWREVNCDAEHGYAGAVKIILDGSSLGFKYIGKMQFFTEAEIEECRSKRSSRKKPSIKAGSYWANIIRERVDAATRLWDKDDAKKEYLTEDVFTYMSLLKFQSKNVGAEQKVYNDYSSAELDLLYTIICILKYLHKGDEYNFNMLKDVFNLCSVNNEGVSPLECYFANRVIYRNDRTIDMVPVKKSLSSQCVVRGKNSAPEFLSGGYVMIKEDSLMKETYQEFMSQPQRVRDEAVKMLSWRLV